MTIHDVSIARLHEYENNPRNNDLAVEKVKYSIERFGFLFPVIIDMNYVIVAGHTRVRACRELGIRSVPCIVADELTEEQINLFRLVDNKTSEYSDWDFEKLKNELSQIDLTLDANQLLLDRFELTAEVFDLEPEQAEIKIPAFNFMGVNEKSKPKKPAVKTIDADEIGTVDELSTPVLADSQPQVEAVQEHIIENTSSEADSFTAVAENTARTETVESKKKESKAVLAFCQFRFGDVAFFISQIELGRLNEKYAEYIDSGKVLECSFVDYLLKGVENT